MDAELKAYLEEKFGALLRQIAGVGSRPRHDPASNAHSGARPDPSERVVDPSLKRLERRIDDLERRMTGLDRRVTRVDARITREGDRFDHLISQLDRRLTGLQSQLTEVISDQGEWDVLGPRLLPPVD